MSVQKEVQMLGLYFSVNQYRKLYFPVLFVHFFINKGINFFLIHDPIYQCERKVCSRKKDVLHTICFLLSVTGKCCRYQEQQESEQGGRKASDVFEKRVVASLVGAHYGKKDQFGLPMER